MYTICCTDLSSGPAFQESVAHTECRESNNIISNETEIVQRIVLIKRLSCYGLIIMLKRVKQSSDQNNHP